RLFGAGTGEAPQLAQEQPRLVTDGGGEDTGADLPAPLAQSPSPSAPSPQSALPQAEPAAAARPAAATVAAPQPSLATPPAASSLDSLPLDARLITGAGDPFALPERTEPGYSTVAPHIAASLQHLLDELELPEHHQPLGEDLRTRLRAGLNWYELVPLLDDLTVLVLAVTDSEQREFAGYLRQLNERLADFLGSLSETNEGYSESVRSARDFDQELHEQVSGLQASVQGAVDLTSLKQALEQRLEGLLGSVDEHRRQRESREQDMA